MSAKTGKFLPTDANDSSQQTRKYEHPTRRRVDDSSNSQERRRKPGNDAAADIPQTYYSPSTNQCEVANLALLSYVTKPYTRSADENDGDGKEKSVCRLTNFIIGDDLARTTVNVNGRAYEIETGRHSKTYCNGFYRSFDEKTFLCYEPWWEQILSYTFVGSALVRLARHAIDGGDRCDTLLATDAQRREIDPRKDVPRNVLSRKHWFDDVKTNWRLPPPNILLSDLGIRELGEVWSNLDGIVRPAEPDDYATSTNSRAADDNIDRAKKTFQTNAAAAAAATTTVKGDARSNRKKRDTSATIITGDDAIANPTSEHPLLDFDRLYSAFVTDDASGSAQNRAFWNSLSLMVVDMATIMAMNAIAIRLTRSAVNRTLRYIGRDMAGQTTRAMISLGIRAATARMVSSVFTRFSTRIVLALGTTASGIGTVIGLVEILAAVLDFMILFGWDPGNYNAQYDNAVYDDLAVGWLRHNQYFRTAPIDPYLIITIFNRNREGALTSDGGDPMEDDDGVTSSRSVSSRTNIATRHDIPWYFSSFERATDAIITDTTMNPELVASSNGTISSIRHAELAHFRPRVKIRLGWAAHTERPGTSFAPTYVPLTRQRPLITDNPVTTSVLVSMHYFRHRSTNSFGQIIRHDDDETSIRITDETISTAVRDNELASFLTSAYSRNEIPRDTLVGAARRNLTSKTITVGLGLLISVTTSLTLVTALLSAISIRRNTGVTVTSKNTNIIFAVVLTTLLFLLPLVIGVYLLETAARDTFARSFERPLYSDPTIANEATQSSFIYDTDFLDESCDAIADLLKSMLDDSNEETRTTIMTCQKILTTFKQELRVIHNA